MADTIHTPGPTPTTVTTAGRRTVAGTHIGPQAGSSSELRPVGPTPFKRLLVWPGVILGAVELVGVAVPLWSVFGLDRVPGSTLWRVGLPVGIAAGVIWIVALATWLAPIRAVIAKKRHGEKVAKELSLRAYTSSLRLPIRVIALRTALWVIAAAAIAGFLVRYEDWPVNRIAELAALAGLHAFLVAGIRGAWLARIMSRLRSTLFAVSPPLRRFADGYFRRLVLVAIVVWGGVLVAQAAFLYYFVPITHTEYLQLETFAPLGGLLGLLAWVAIAWRLTRRLRAYLKAAQAEGGGVSGAADTYRGAQALPYRLAIASMGVWLAYTAVSVIVALYLLRLATDDTVIMVTATLVVSVAGAIYAALWHRETLQPLLAHLTQRYRVPVRGIAPSLSLRSKLLIAFGGVVLLACGMALVWGFLLYKNQATESVARQADIGLAWLRSEVQGEVAAMTEPPTPARVRESLRTIAGHAPEASAVLYYVAGDADPLAVGGGPMGAPILPWYRVAEIRAARSQMLSLGPADLTGRAGRLDVSWHGRRYALGSIAVFYPSYRGRGSMVRPLKELVVFFIVLFGACGGIVIVTVGQFVSPIRRLERRADGMARGELADPVQSSGEGDEIGRLTYALEEMRRALRDKLRSTEEVNLDLERAVQMRTADLAKKNRELAETLDKLTRAQEQLVRSEKLASIGQLVAGIAHEINNPVNAIVNTVGPLEEAIGDVDSADATARHEAAKDIRDMVRVVQRGAQRTKAIVTALHNYSRTDDENVVEFDLDRSIDDSLELLRHLLKQHVTVDKKFGEVGKLKGHAGQINQVFMNLLTNAAQALASREDDARITIETARDGDDVITKIGDNGPGIPAEVLPRIWDPFFTTKDVGEGTGLGLSIVHELVERHHGTITVDTELGVGTTFTIRLPRVPPDVRRPNARG